MRQEKLFYEDVNDAIGTAIQALGGYKKVACELWPSMKAESAYARLKNCLRDDKDEKLSPAELILIAHWARDAGSHAITEYFCDATNYERPVPREPEDERVKLQRAFMDSVRLQKQIVERMESLGQTVTHMRMGDRRAS